MLAPLEEATELADELTGIYAEKSEFEEAGDDFEEFDEEDFDDEFDDDFEEALEDEIEADDVEVTEEDLEDVDLDDVEIGEVDDDEDGFGSDPASPAEDAEDED